MIERDFEKAELLPDSRLRTIVTPKGMIQGPGGMWVPVFCANCGADGGMCPEESTFLFYLCNDCFKTHGHIAGTLMMPDEVFWARVAQEQIERYGRILTTKEVLAALSDPESLESKLARDRALLTPKA
jgi:hypothetical protein